MPITEARVMNVRSGETTRYTNYDFNYIINAGGSYIGVKSDGLYFFNGTTDNDTPINGKILTNDTDFGSNASKRVQYCYLNSDTQTSITPYVDGIKKNKHKSSFGGRKTQMALGSSGRYWQFLIEKIQRLESVEFLPTMLSRRIK